MDFTPTPSQQMTQRSVREFVRKEVVPLSQALDENDEFPKALYCQALALEILPQQVSRLVARGLGDRKDASERFTHCFPPKVFKVVC